jgi:hypothetical protein
MPRKRRMSSEQFAKGFAKIAADYLDTVPIEERDARIAALKHSITNSGPGTRPKGSQNVETPATPLADRTCE